MDKYDKSVLSSQQQNRFSIQTENNFSNERYMLSQDTNIANANPAFNMFMKMKYQYSEQIVPLFELPSSSSGDSPLDNNSNRSNYNFNYHYKK